MRLLLIDATADTSSRDYFDGYAAALKRAGVETYVYNANGRIGVAASWLDYCWQKGKRLGEDRPRPNALDTLYHAGIWSLEMALRLDPDWIIVVAGMYFSKLNMQLLRKASYPFSKMALMICDAPFDDNQIVNCLGLYDQIFVNEQASVPIYQQFNPEVTYLPACYDPERHHPAIEIPEGTPSHDVLFVGSAFRERVDLLSAVDWTGIDFALYGSWSGLGSRSKLRQYVRGGPVSNDQAAQLYRAAKVCLNLHRSRLSSPPVPLPPGMAKSLNPRAYELAACGAFTLSDRRDELPAVFGDLVPTFSTPKELEGLIRAYVPAEPLRRSVAARLPAAAAGHTYDARTATLLEVLGRAEPLAARAG